MKILVLSGPQICFADEETFRGAGMTKIFVIGQVLEKSSAEKFSPDKGAIHPVGISTTGEKRIPSPGEIIEVVRTKDVFSTKGRTFLFYKR